MMPNRQSTLGNPDTRVGAPTSDVGGRQSGFTLIELLVVVAIIALLAAILLPALNRARDRAKQTLCGGNMRQFALAAHLYADDYGGWTPFWVDDPPSQWWIHENMYWKYLHPASYSAGNNSPVDFKWLRCPLITDNINYGIGYSWGIGINSPYFNFGANRHRLSDPRAPDQHMMVMDAKGPHAWYYLDPNGDFRHMIRYNPPYSTPSLQTTEGIANVAFTDGHLGTERWADVKLSTGPKYEAFWHGN